VSGESERFCEVITMKGHLVNVLKIVLNVLPLLSLTGCFCGQFFRGPDDVVGVTISPVNTSILPGATQQFTATGTFGGSGTTSDGNGTTGDVTLMTTWNSSDSSIVSIDKTGLARGNKLGTVTISGSCQCYGAQTTLTVSSQATAAALLSTAVTPVDATSQAWQKQQLTATGIYSNGTTSVIADSALWASDNRSATVSRQKLATGISPGHVTIYASSSDVKGKSALKVQ
jgi:trimeric autotransporter adhesin